MRTGLGRFHDLVKGISRKHGLPVRYSEPQEQVAGWQAEYVDWSEVQTSSVKALVAHGSVGGAVRNRTG